VRINDQPSSIWVGNFVKAMGKSSKLVWKKRPITPDILKEEPELSVVQSMAVLKKASAEPEHLASKAHMPLAKLAAENESSLDILEQKRLGQIEDHFDFVIGKLNQSYTNVPAARTAKPAKTSAAPVAEVEPRIVDRNKENLAGDQSLRSQTITPVDIGENKVAIHQPIGSEPVASGVVEEPAKQVSRPVETPVVTVSEPKQLQQEPEQERLTEEPATADVQQEEAAPLSFVKSNIITGVVVDSADKAIKDAMVIIKTSEEELVRKIQSNSRGFVTLTTPLPAGDYYIDIEAKGYKFNRYQVQVNDQVLPVFKFIAK
jgi:hypothetical protein